MSEPGADTVQGTFSITLHRAKNLKSSPHFHLSPFAVIELSCTKHRYTTQPAVKGDVTPVWNAEFDFTVDFNRKDTLRISLFDQQRTEWKDCLGLLVLELGVMVHPKYYGTQWLALRSPVNPMMIVGEIELSISYSGAMIEDDGSHEDKRVDGARKPTFHISGSEFDLGVDGGDDALTMTAATTDGEGTDTAISRNNSNSSNSSESSDRVETGHTGSRDSVNSTATTDTTPDSTDSGDTPSDEGTLADRRSSSFPAPIPTCSNSLPSPSSISPPPSYTGDPNDTYSHQQDRQLSSFLPSLSNGQPIIHSSAKHGLLYDDTTSFDDRNFLNVFASTSHICEIKIWSRDYIHGLQITYAVGDDGDGCSADHISTPKYMGKVHTTEHVFKVHHTAGEYIIGISGTYKEWLETLTITTNRRQQTYGGNIDSRPNRWVPASMKVSPISFTCYVPAGHRVVGFHGGYGVHVHNLGVFHQPINESDKRGKKNCFLRKLRRKFGSRSRLVSIGSIGGEEGEHTVQLQAVAHTPQQAQTSQQRTGIFSPRHGK